MLTSSLRPRTPDPLCTVRGKRDQSAESISARVAQRFPTFLHTHADRIVEVEDLPAAFNVKSESSLTWGQKLRPMSRGANRSGTDSGTSAHSYWERLGTTRASYPGRCPSDADGTRAATRSTAVQRSRVQHAQMCSALISAQPRDLPWTRRTRATRNCAHARPHLAPGPAMPSSHRIMSDGELKLNCAAEAAGHVTAAVT